jgi:hypothetical protein
LSFSFCEIIVLTVDEDKFMAVQISLVELN